MALAIILIFAVLITVAVGVAVFGPDPHGPGFGEEDD